ncbi:DUF887-domain-containing protein [Hysterangium stoloniferum]|nr:DUF887-domain-containing protein [Hysterangium stoloniferum]
MCPWSLSDSLNGLDRLLYRASIPLSEILSLPHLPSHFSTVVASFASFQIIEWISPYVLQRLSPNHYGRANARVKHSWAVHMSSMAHCFVILPMAIAAYDAPQLEKDKAFAFTDAAGRLHAVACGFLWDVLDTITHFTDIAFVIHGLICLMVFSQVFRPFLAYYGSRFLFWELSTIFLNVHWLLDKTNRTGGTFQLVNGIILIAVFFLVRICYGGIVSLSFLQTMKEIRSQISPLTFATYLIGNFSLQGLNWFWYLQFILLKWSVR